MKSLLPQEVVMEILSWLPATSLLRFRCVCKSWNQLLRDPYFIQLHLRLHQSIEPNNNNHLNSDKQFLFLSNRYDCFGPTDFHCAINYNACHKAKKLYVRRSKRYVVIGICNGLICLARSLSEILVWNPLIRDHITISCSHLQSDLYGTTTGFGFLQSTNDYKLIRIVQSESEYFCSHVNVYTLGSTDSWRTLEPILYTIWSRTKFVNEALHWLAARQIESLSTYYWNSILCFDLKDEVFQEIPQPNGFKDYYCSFHVELGELNGLLCMFCILPDEDVQIWVMKEYGVVDSWTKQFKIGRLKVPIHDCLYSMQPLGLANNGGIILRKDNWQLILYNPKTNSTRSLKKFIVSFDHVYAFVGSLVSPSSFNGVYATDDTDEDD